jgi:hypothetical protein
MHAFIPMRAECPGDGGNGLPAVWTVDMRRAFDRGAMSARRAQPETQAGLHDVTIVNMVALCPPRCCTSGGKNGYAGP